MITYEVRQVANLPCSDMPGYRNGIEVYKDGDFKLGHYGSPSCGVTNDCDIIVQTQQVMASSPSAAERKFNDWRRFGHSVLWLAARNRTY